MFELLYSSSIHPINSRVYSILQCVVNIPSGTESGSRSRGLISETMRSIHNGPTENSDFIGNNRGVDPHSPFAEFDRPLLVQRIWANLEGPSRKELATDSCRGSPLARAVGEVTRDALHPRRLLGGPCLRAWTNGHDSVASGTNTA